MPCIRRFCERHNVELCFTPTYSSWANPAEAHFGPLREFVLNNSDDLSHSALTRRLHAYLRWRNEHRRDPAVLALERKRRAERAKLKWSRR